MSAQYLLHLPTKRPGIISLDFSTPTKHNPGNIFSKANGKIAFDILQKAFDALGMILPPAKYIGQGVGIINKILTDTGAIGSKDQDEYDAAIRLRDAQVEKNAKLSRESLAQQDRVFRGVQNLSYMHRGIFG